MTKIQSLRDRDTTFDISAGLELLRLPERFKGTSFGSYIPNPNYPSQELALKKSIEFVTSIEKESSRSPLRRRFSSDKRASARGIYLDGGFGVGKSHLLSSIYERAPEPKAFASFIDLVNVVGAFGFERAYETIRGLNLICIDEFELDDPAETVLIANLLNRARRDGLFIAATSNTLPEKLGDGRFAAQDFLREIQSLRDAFEVITIDGPDYRATNFSTQIDAMDSTVLLEKITSVSTLVTTLDPLEKLLGHLTKAHPIMFKRMIEPFDAIIASDGWTIDSISNGLRLVVFIDRCYESMTPFVIGEITLSDLFSEQLMASGYRKKFGRAISRLIQMRYEIGSAIDGIRQ
ncbi:MAG: cell division protein ZapE [Actinomycetota bacterium]|nr:cell division protein ZapE [Actinomycetota bacterium]